MCAGYFNARGLGYWYSYVQVCKGANVQVCKSVRVKVDSPKKNRTVEMSCRRIEGGLEKPV